MFYGWAGWDLYVDLSSGKCERVEADADERRKFLGGRGISAKLMWDRAAPEVEPFSAANPLIVAAGALDGTLCPGANRTVVTTKSPQTRLQTYSLFGGFFGPELKAAGYDTLFITGKSSRPVYLFIADRRVEVRDATHLWGKDTLETQRYVRQECDSEAQIMCVGPAGEKRVYCASIQHANGASASRAGVGAVMGDKNLKAIAVRGSGEIRIARSAVFGELCDRVLATAARQKAFVDDISHNQQAGIIRQAVYGNQESELRLAEKGDEHAAFLRENSQRRPACFNCQIACRRAVSLRDTGISYVKCISNYTYFAAFKIDDFAFNSRAMQLTERLGMDAMSASALGAFAIDLYQRGILTDRDTCGMKLRFGDPAVALALISQIARREGIGEMLANGVCDAASQIGRGAEKFAYHIKRLEMAAASHNIPYIGYAAAVADRPDLTRLISYVPQHLLNKSTEFKREYVESPFWPYPKEWGQYVMDPFDRNGGDWKRLSLMMSYDEDELNAADCSGVCSFWATFFAFGPIRGRLHAELVAAATGADIDLDELLTIGARSSALIRAYNVAAGLGRRDDTLPPKFFQEGASPLYPPMSRDNLDKVIEAYYGFRGWDRNGIPTKERLSQLGLEPVATEVERRGLYTDQPS